MNYTSTMQTKTNGCSLPEGWQWAKLGDVCDFIRRVSFKPHDTRPTPTPDYLPILRAGNIGDSLDLQNDLIWVKNNNVSHEQRFQIGDVAICMASGSPAVVGKTAQLKEHFAGSVGAFCGIIRPKGSVQSNYIALWLRSPDFLKWRDSQARGANIQNLRFSQFVDLAVPLPPQDEQRRIASRLNKQLTAVESGRKAAEEQLQAAWQLPSAYLKDVFESEEAKEWKLLQLGDVAEIVGGVQKTPDRAPTNFHKPYLTVRNVQQGYLDLSQIERFEVTPSEFERCRLRSGDILIVEGNGSIDQIGRNALFQLDGDDWIHQNHIIRVRLPKEKFIPKFVSLFLNSHLGRLQMVDKAKTTSGLYTLSSGKVASLEIPSPLLNVQEKIVQDLNIRLADVSNIQASLESQLAEINRLPASLLREAFAGRLFP